MWTYLIDVIEVVYFDDVVYCSMDTFYCLEVDSRFVEMNEDYFVVLLFYEDVFWRFLMTWSDLIEKKTKLTSYMAFKGNKKNIHFAGD